jgi:adenine deaminase
VHVTLRVSDTAGRIVRHPGRIQQGIDSIAANQMGTIKTAFMYRIERDFGSLSSGKFADIVILDDLEALSVDKVLVHGRQVSENGITSVAAARATPSDTLTMSSRKRCSSRRTVA